ncbi:hypothetical protein KQ945_05455 [Bacillus subtilis subsp. subtilis]|nr:hypothetical protein [Bacillus subtilis subsp. subtilis]
MTDLLVCIGQDGEQHPFLISLPEPTPDLVTFYVVHSDYPSATPFRLVLDNSGAEALVEAMTHDGEVFYARKGVPDAALLYASRHLGKTVRSHAGPAGDPYANYRWPNADKVWVRLAARGHAVYNVAEDVYRTNGRTSQS